MEFKADMHCHSTFSDGTLTPFEILDLAKTLHLKGLSITDHDTIDAYSLEFLDKAKNMQIEIIPGVEFSCQQSHYPIHVLGYNFSLECLILKDLCLRHAERRKQRNRVILEKLKSRGLNILEEELESSKHIHHVIGRPHIAAVMVKKGYVSSIEEAFKKYIGEGRPCYDMGDIITVEETIEIIHKAKGKVFIAHPHLITKKEILKELLSLPFDGIECYYANFPMHKNIKWLDIAERHHLLISGGSDFHGSVKPNIALGSSYVNLETFDKIRKCV